MTTAVAVTDESILHGMEGGGGSFVVVCEQVQHPSARQNGKNVEQVRFVLGLCSRFVRIHSVTLRDENYSTNAASTLLREGFASSVLWQC